MGLSTIIYTNVELKKKQELDYENDNEFHAFVIVPEWIDRISDLKDQAIYVGISKPMQGVSYSYSTHGNLRRAICEKMLGIDWEDIKPGQDFEKWINFADNEGCISWTTCKALYEQFKKWLPVAKDSLQGWQLQCYEQWMSDFELAGNNMGVIEYR